MSPSKIFSTLITCLSLQKCYIFLQLTRALPLTTWNYMALVLTNLKRAFDVLLYRQYSFSRPCLYDIPNSTSEEFIQMTRYKSNDEEGDRSAENVDDRCAVCLGEVQEGDEIGELKCSHVFHQHCLESWVRSTKHTTCPLCRGSLAPPQYAAGAVGSDFGVEVLFFKFCSFGSNDRERDSWWLR